MGIFSNKRSAGVLLHITSLPGGHGIGDFGKEALDFIGWLKKSGFCLWQVLPLGHTGFGDSPYQCFSAFAGNPLLISINNLKEIGLLSGSDEIFLQKFPKDYVDYGLVYTAKYAAFRRAWKIFATLSPNSTLKRAFFNFINSPRIAEWLDDYAMFMSLKEHFNGSAWTEWPNPIKTRKATALCEIQVQLQESISFYKFIQFLFFRQWETIRSACNDAGIKIIGDIPIYVAQDSADTWSHQSCFLLDDAGKPKCVAGVPPDYFSNTGQFWGNPIYDWEKMARNGYKWWIKRLKASLALYDYVRLDHFRGFFGYWSIPADAAYASEGKWIKGPGLDFFHEISKSLEAPLPLIAEDLGEITTDVHAGRDILNMPGMKILQFAWTPRSMEPLIPDFNSQYLPHQIIDNSVIYTGTHDNDTTRGWWNTADKRTRTCLQVYLSVDGQCIHNDLMRAAFASTASAAIVPIQDILGLGSEARMNCPGKPDGNWAWRLGDFHGVRDCTQKIRDFLLLYDRCANPPETVKTQAKEPTY